MLTRRHGNTCIGESIGAETGKRRYPDGFLRLCSTLRAWDIDTARLRKPVRADLATFEAELGEFRVVAAFLRDRGFARDALRTSSPSSFLTVSALREELHRVRSTLAAAMAPEALVALRVFVASKHSHTFTSRFDAIRSKGIDGLPGAGRAALAVSAELETLISSGSVRLSEFAAVLDRLRAAGGTFSAERIRDELGVVRARCTSRLLFSLADLAAISSSLTGSRFCRCSRADGFRWRTR